MEGAAVEVAKLPPIALNVAEAAVFVGMSANQVHALCMQGVLPWIKVGDVVRLRYDDLKAFFDGLPVEHGVG